MAKTTIAIENETVARLQKHWAHAKDTYDKVINKILDEVEKNDTS